MELKIPKLFFLWSKSAHSMNEALGTAVELLLSDSRDSCQVSDNKASKKCIIIEATWQKVRFVHLLGSIR